MTKKLQDTFNNCAGKIVSERELEQLVMNSLKSQLTAEEMETYKTISRADEKNTDNLFSDDETFVSTLVGEIGDGSIGIYWKVVNGIGTPTFVHTKYLEMTLGKGFPKTALAEKVLNAHADAIEKAGDYRDEVNTGVKHGNVMALKPSGF